MWSRGGAGAARNTGRCTCTLCPSRRPRRTDPFPRRLRWGHLTACPSCFDRRIVAHVYLSPSCFLIVLASCASLSLPLYYVSLSCSFWLNMLSSSVVSVVVALSLVSLLMLPFVAHLYPWFLLSCYDADGFHLHSLLRHLSPRCYHWFTNLSRCPLFSLSAIATDDICIHA